MKTAPLYRTLKNICFSAIALLSACTSSQHLASNKEYDDAYYTTAHQTPKPAKENLVTVEKPAETPVTSKQPATTNNDFNPDYEEEGYVVNPNQYYDPLYNQPNFGQGWNTTWGNQNVNWGRYYNAYNQYPFPTSQWGNNWGWNTSIGWNNNAWNNNPWNNNPWAWNNNPWAWNNPYSSWNNWNDPWGNNNWNTGNGWTYTTSWNNQTGWSSGWSYNWGWGGNNWNSGWGGNRWNSGWGWGGNRWNNSNNPIAISIGNGSTANGYRGPRYRTGNTGSILPASNGQIRVREGGVVKPTTNNNGTIRTREDFNNNSLGGKVEGGNKPYPIDRNRNEIRERPTPNDNRLENPDRNRNEVGNRPTPNNNRLENPDRNRNEIRERPTPNNNRVEKPDRNRNEIRERPTPNNNRVENPDRNRNEIRERPTPNNNRLENPDRNRNEIRERPVSQPRENTERRVETPRNNNNNAPAPSAPRTRPRN